MRLVDRSRTTAALAGLALAAVMLSAALPSHKPGEMLVYKSATCGCCKKWVDQMRQQGFTVTTRDEEDMTPIKADLGVPAATHSCHTAVIDGYVIEGHVPAADIKRLLKEKPKVVGIAVPGMVVGSPGMEGPDPEPYDVVTFDAKGQTTVYAKH